jgi:hypothetical protein
VSEHRGRQGRILDGERTYCASCGSETIHEESGERYCDYYVYCTNAACEHHAGEHCGDQECPDWAHGAKARGAP